MPQRKGYLHQLLGTSTKIKILEQLTLDPTPLTRHALCKSISTGVGPTYEQVDQVIALGALKEINGRIELDESFPFYDDITNIVISSAHYMDDLRIPLDRVDALFGNDYYITGYLAARQNGPPMDHEQDSALIAILDPDHRAKNYLEALAAVASTEMDWFETDSIPGDVKRLDIYGSKVWMASAERGLVDCVVHRDCDLYVVVLLLFQNIMDGNIDIDRLLDIADNVDFANDMDNDMDFVDAPCVRATFIMAIAGLNAAAGKPGGNGREIIKTGDIVPLDPQTIINAEQEIGAVQCKRLADTAKMAYNTLMGG